MDFVESGEHIECTAAAGRITGDEVNLEADLRRIANESVGSAIDSPVRVTNTYPANVKLRGVSSASSPISSSLFSTYAGGDRGGGSTTDLSPPKSAAVAAFNSGNDDASSAHIAIATSPRLTGIDTQLGAEDHCKLGGNVDCKVGTDEDCGTAAKARLEVVSTFAIAAPDETNAGSDFTNSVGEEDAKLLHNVNREHPHTSEFDIKTLPVSYPPVSLTPVLPSPSTETTQPPLLSSLKQPLDILGVVVVKSEPWNEETNPKSANGRRLSDRSGWPPVQHVPISKHDAKRRVGRPRKCDVEDPDNSGNPFSVIKSRVISRKSTNVSCDDDISCEDNIEEPIVIRKTNHPIKINFTGDKFEVGEKSIIKRKAGRPRKSNKTVDNSSGYDNSDELNFKRKAGRPRKSNKTVDIDISSGDDIGDELNIKRNAGRPRKRKNINDVDTSSENNNNGELNFKRNAGRPRKRKNINDVDTSSGYDNSGELNFKRKAGRPRKSNKTVDIDYSSGYDISDELNIKRKAGRPRKSNKTVDIDYSSGYDISDELNIKRKAGRPRKSNKTVDIDYSSGYDNSGELNIKRKAGRPRKSNKTIDDRMNSVDNNIYSKDEDFDRDIEAFGKRKVGRPRKSVAGMNSDQTGDTRDETIDKQKQINDSGDSHGNSRETFLKRKPGRPRKCDVNCDSTNGVRNVKGNDDELQDESISNGRPFIDQKEKSILDINGLYYYI